MCRRFEARGPVTLLFLQGVEVVDVLCAGDGDRAPPIPLAVVIPARKTTGMHRCRQTQSPVQAADMPTVCKGWLSGLGCRPGTPLSLREGGARRRRRWEGERLHPLRSKHGEYVVGDAARIGQDSLIGKPQDQIAK